MPVEVRTSQSTNSLSPRGNDSNNSESDLFGEYSREFVNHPEDDDDIFDDVKFPEEKAAADLRATRRRGYDPNSSHDDELGFIIPFGSGIIRILDSLTRESNQKEESPVGLP